MCVCVYSTVYLGVCVVQIYPLVLWGLCNVFVTHTYLCFPALNKQAWVIKGGALANLAKPVTCGSM